MEKPGGIESGTYFTTVNKCRSGYKRAEVSAGKQAEESLQLKA